MNHAVLRLLNPEQVEVEICRSEELDQRREVTSELDEMWSFVRCKANPRWLWHAIDHRSGKVLAYVFGRRKDAVFLELKKLLEPFGITRYYTDGWGVYERHLEPEQHRVGKDKTQKIESKHINLRTRIKRLVRRTICFSKTERMHDLICWSVHQKAPGDPGIYAWGGIGVGRAGLNAQASNHLPWRHPSPRWARGMRRWKPRHLCLGRTSTSKVLKIQWVGKSQKPFKKCANREYFENLFERVDELKTTSRLTGRLEPWGQFDGQLSQKMDESHNLQKFNRLKF